MVCGDGLETFGETAFKSIFYDIPVQEPVNPCNNSEETVGIINDKKAKHHKCVHLENHKIHFPQKTSALKM